MIEAPVRLARLRAERLERAADVEEAPPFQMYFSDAVKRMRR
jgi:hypothetical protein